MEIKATACRVLGEALLVNRALYAEVEGDDWMVAKCYEQGVAPLYDGAHSAGTYGRWIMAAYREGERIVFCDTRTTPASHPPSGRHTPRHASLDCPNRSSVRRARASSRCRCECDV